MCFLFFFFLIFYLHSSCKIFKYYEKIGYKQQLFHHGSLMTAEITWIYLFMNDFQPSGIVTQALFCYLFNMPLNSWKSHYNSISSNISSSNIKSLSWRLYEITGSHWLRSTWTSLILFLYKYWRDGYESLMRILLMDVDLSSKLCLPVSLKLVLLEGLWFLAFIKPPPNTAFLLPKVYIICYCLYYGKFNFG